MLQHQDSHHHHRRSTRWGQAVLPLTLLCAMSTASAAEIYGGYGAVTGLNLGMSLRLSTHVGVRAEGHTFSMNRQVDVDGDRFKVEAQFRGGGVYADLHPFAGRFRLTIGVGGGTHRFGGASDTSSGLVNIGGKDVRIAAGDFVSLQARYPTTMPYVGIGFGHHAVEPGLRVYSDLGAFIGRPKATIQVSDNLRRTGGVTEADIRAEEQNAQSELNKLRVLPVIRAGMGYTF